MVCEILDRFAKAFEHDTTLRFVDHLASLNIPSYYSLDAHLGWRPIPQVEFSIGGQNLLDNQHLEFISRLHQYSADRSETDGLRQHDVQVLTG